MLTKHMFARESSEIEITININFYVCHNIVFYYGLTSAL